MNLQYPHIAFLAGIVCYLVVRGIFQSRSASDGKSIKRASIRDRLLNALVVFAQIGLPLLLLFSSWLNRANYTLPEFANWVGGGVMTAALWLFWRAHADLGNSWSLTLELNHNHRLVTYGVYRRIRHPMYASFFLMAFSQALMLSNWAAGWSALAAVSFLYFVRKPHEEQMMLEFFGDEYRDYIKQTGGIFPRI